MVEQTLIQVVVPATATSEMGVAQIGQVGRSMNTARESDSFR
jgi:hypothetical protein